MSPSPSSPADRQCNRARRWTGGQHGQNPAGEAFGGNEPDPRQGHEARVGGPSASSPRKSGVSSSFLPEKMNRHRVTPRKDELTSGYPPWTSKVRPGGHAERASQRPHLVATTVAQCHVNVESNTIVLFADTYGIPHDLLGLGALGALPPAQAW